MPDLRTIIKETENEWLETLYIKVKEIFIKYGIHSHNEDHHLRVWNYSVMLTEALHEKGIKINKSDLENLIIAVFFHDTGLIKTPGPDHGKSGSNFCKEWLETQSLSDKADTETILHAIEHHDDKDYFHHNPLSTNGRMNLLSILGISDDLDAFGFTGIYRYMEIYLLRGTPFKELGQQVLDNITNRFRNFLQQCVQFPSLINIHTIRYNDTVHFYERYNTQLHDNPQWKNISSGPYPVTRFIYREIIQGNTSVERLCKKGMQEFSDTSDREFFINLIKEWKIEITGFKSAKK